MSESHYPHEQTSNAVSDGSLPLLRPTPPIAKRLNRNALTVAAVVMGMTVLTAVVLINPRRSDGSPPAGSQTTNEDTPVPAQPSFLDQPARMSATSGSPSGRGDSAPPAAGVHETTSIASERADYSGAGANTLLSSSPAAPSSTSQESPREHAYQAALTSAVTVGSGKSQPSPEPAVDDMSTRQSLAADEGQLLQLGDSVLRASMVRGAGDTQLPRSSASPSAAAVPDRLTDTARAIPFGSAEPTTGRTILARIEAAGSPYTLRAGTIIPGILITGINSELPGEIMGQVSRDVYDSHLQRVLLIPKGARLIGTYDNQVVAGKGRMLVAWTRLILPDGRSMHLPGLALKDRQGQTGIAGAVDNHWRRVFGNALLLSAIGAGVQLSQPRQASVLAAPSAGQVASGALGQELSNVALEILRRGMDVAPTITVPSGQQFLVFLNGDLVFDAPYHDAAVSWSQ